MIFEVWNLRKSIKIDPKSMLKRIQKKHRKKPSQKSILASILASKNLPKSSKIAKIRKKRLRKNVVKKEAMEIKPRGRDPPARQAFWDPEGPSNYLSNDQYFSIDLPLVALIIKASPSTLNVSHMLLVCFSPQNPAKKLFKFHKIILKTSKILLKSVKNLLISFPNRSQNGTQILNALRVRPENACCSIFFEFLIIF